MGFVVGKDLVLLYIHVLYNQQLWTPQPVLARITKLPYRPWQYPLHFFFNLCAETWASSQKTTHVLYSIPYLPPPFFFGTGWTTPTSNQQNTKRHNHTSIEISVRAPTCLWRFIRCTTRKPLPSRNPFTSWRSRAWFSLNHLQYHHHYPAELAA